MKRLTLKQKIFSSLKIIGILWIISSIVAMFFAVDTDFVAGGNVAVVVPDWVSSCVPITY